MPREISNHEPNLDLLRALAVLLALASHVLETLGFAKGGDFHPYDWYLGRLGLLLFFVHTCYVLMGSLERLRASGGSLVRAFYVRRAFRLYPLALLAIAIFLLFAIPPVPWKTFATPGVVTFVSNALLTTNLTLSPPIVGPLWALALEVQMYLLLPFIFLHARRATDLRKIGVGYAAAVVLAFVLPGISERIAGAQYAPCFMAGVVAFALRARMQPSLAGALWPLLLAALVVVYVAIEQVTPGIHHVALQVAICLALGFAIPAFRQSGAALLNRVAHEIARYSYGVYLFHCLALWVAYYRFEAASPYLQPAIALALLVVLPVAGYHLIEAPAIRLGARLAARRAVPKASAQTL